MIKSLTKEQEALIGVHQKIAFDIGLSTTQVDNKKAIKAIKAAYKVAGRDVPKYFVFAKSPIEGLRMANAVEHMNEKLDTEKDLQTQLEALIESKEFKSLDKKYIEAFFGSFEAPYLEFYNYFHTIGKQYLESGESENKEDFSNIVKSTEKLQPLYELCKYSGWVFMFTDVVIFTNKPTQIHLKNNVLHNENGPSISYSDGFSIYSLNGVQVTKQIVMTPVDEFDTKMLLKEENAEIRREIVRKVGILKVLEDLNAKVLDSKTVTIKASKETIETAKLHGITVPETRQEEYELLNLEIRPGDFRPYLKMKNPSIGTFHVEGVGPECKTVDDALKFRAKKTGESGKFVPPQVLT